MTRNHEIIAGYTGSSDQTYIGQVERAMRGIAGELWGELDLDDFNHVMERALAELDASGPHVLRFRPGPGHVPHPVSHRTPLTMARCEEIARVSGTMRAAAVCEALLAGRAVHTEFSLYRME